MREADQDSNSQLSGPRSKSPVVESYCCSWPAPRPNFQEPTGVQALLQPFLIMKRHKLTVR